MLRKNKKDCHSHTFLVGIQKNWIPDEGIRRCRNAGMTTLLFSVQLILCVTSVTYYVHDIRDSLYSEYYDKKMRSGGK